MKKDSPNQVYFQKGCNNVLRIVKKKKITLKIAHAKFAQLPVSQLLKHLISLVTYSFNWRVPTYRSCLLLLSY